MIKKIYYKLILEQTSPLRIGNGKHEESDSDLMLDGRGLPFIPGTSLAGIFRHRAIENDINKNVEMRLFGTVSSSKEGEENQIIKSSSILFGDAVLKRKDTSADVTLGRRDGIGLGEWGTSKRTSKFDFQISETEGKFCSIIEWEGNEEQYRTEIIDIIEPILRHFIADGIKVGARTSRGYGNLKVIARKMTFDFPKDIERWIEFNPYSESAFECAESLTGKMGISDRKVEISFKMISPFSVRVNTARTEIVEDGTVPDTIPMENFKGNPVIPGTAWAGAFRHHMHDLLRDIGVVENSEEMQRLDMLFGISGNSENNKKSKISFSETEILIADKKMQKISVMRTAIDRFTASTRTAALFTDIVYLGGTGTLYITFDKKNIADEYLELIAACICDMHMGLISLGGDASVGRGVMQVTGLRYNGIDKLKQMRDSIDGKPLDWLKEESKNA